MSEQASEPKRVLVTGSTGAIGEPLCQHLLSRGHFVRGFARRPTPGLEDFVQGDLNERDKVYQAVEGMDTIIHLGAYPNPADFIDVLLQPNVVGSYYICEAAKDLGVKRLVLASTLQTVTGHKFDDRPVTVEDGPKPVNHYALTKVWLEAMGDMYARVHHLSVINVRIGWLPRNYGEAERLAQSPMGKNVFFSHEDSNRFHERCVESPNPAPGQSVTLFATSIPAEKARLDLELAREVIGYVPQNVWPEGLPYSVEGLV
ncbi:MAG: NAD(P)-dependent oxidoreductase [Caldilineaceae bacterium]|nr:NAD(P)-dependent oxidoreductase [Caldilineaceae bacterium]